MKSKIKKVSKGYRLRPETHRLVNKIKELTKTDTDTVIYESCRLFLAGLKNGNKHFKILNHNYESN